MAQANPITPPSKSRKVSKIYPALPNIKDERREIITANSTYSISEHSSLVAGDTLSDWRRKSATARPARYHNNLLGNRRERRRRSRLNVHLYRQGKALGTTRILDMNSKGIGVERGKLDLHKGEVVEIDLPENAIPDGMKLHARCLVIHAGEQCGLMILGLKGR